MKSLNIHPIKVIQYFGYLSFFLIHLLGSIQAQELKELNSIHDIDLGSYSDSLDHYMELWQDSKNENRELDFLNEFLLSLQRGDLANNHAKAIMITQILDTYYKGSHYNLGITYQSLATHFNKTDLDLYKSCYEMATRLFIDNSGKIEEGAISIMSIGSTFDSNDKYAKGIKYIKEGYRMSGFDFTQTSNLNLSHFFIKSGQYDSAIFTLNLGIEYLSKRNRADEMWILGLCYLNLGEALFANNEFTDGINHLKKSINTLSEAVGEYHTWSSLALLNLGSLYRKIKLFPKAQNCFEKTKLILDSLSNDIKYETSLRNESIVKQTLDLHYEMALLTYERKKPGYLIKSKTQIQKSIQCLDQLNDMSQDGVSKENLFQEYNKIIESGIMIDLAAFNHYKNYDFIINAYSKSRFYKNNNLENAFASNLNTKSPKKVKVLNNLNKKIWQNQKLLDDLLIDLPILDQVFHPLSEKLLYLRLQKAVYLYDFYLKDKSQDEPQSVDSDNLSIVEIQRKLKSDNFNIIEFFEGEKKVFLFLITQNSIDVQVLEKDIEYLNALNSLSTNLYDLDKRTDTFNDKDLYTLYQKLIEPIDESITSKKLLIIPDGELLRIPFDALVTQYSGPKSARRTKYLIEKYQICYELSIEYFLNSVKQDTELSYLGFAPIGNDGLPKIYASNHGFNVYRDGFEALPYSRDEIKQAAGHFDGKAYYGKEATKETFIKEVQSHSILHLATHAIADIHNSFLKSGFFLQNNEGQYEIINNYEIYPLDLNASLLVLSACNSGYGEFKPGEGLSSIARAFRYAGAQNILMSQWKANDYVTHQIITDYFKNISKGYGVSSALRKSKLNFLQNEQNEKYLDPQYWAGFVLIGNDLSLVINHDIIGQLIWLIPILLFTIWFIFYLRKKGKFFFNKDT